MCRIGYDIVPNTRSQHLGPFTNNIFQLFLKLKDGNCRRYGDYFLKSTEGDLRLPPNGVWTTKYQLSAD